MAGYSLFIRTPWERLGLWQRTRTPWGLMGLLSVLVLTVSHLVFQQWLLMPPCEECVYIRFAFFVMATGALFTVIAPERLGLRLTGYGLIVSAAVDGIAHCITLMNIHTALHSGNPGALFGVKLCSLTPQFPGGLPLHEWWPALFQPGGPCGADTPVVPPDAVLGEWRQSVIDGILDAGGWYLFPHWQIGTMAECAAMLFLVTAGWTLTAMAADLFARRCD